MKLVSHQMRLSATDLSNHLACHHLTNLELCVERGERTAPDTRAPDLVVLQQLGLRYEVRYLEFLRASGLEVIHFGELKNETRIATETEKAMERGVPVIAQGAVSQG